MKDKNLDLNTSADLPESSASYQGGTNGALGGANRQALKRGFIDCNEHESYENEAMPMDEPHGFAGRPHGWER